MRLRSIAAAFGLLWLGFAGSAEAAKTHVAVAANFTEPAREIAARFREKTGHEAVLIFGASGAFYTQIQDPRAMPAKKERKASADWPVRRDRSE